jgi:hypothetical protein
MKFRKKLKDVVATTTNSRVYKMTRKQVEFDDCPMCSPHRGCNRYRNRWNDKSWKTHRKVQYRICDLRIEDSDNQECGPNPHS